MSKLISNVSITNTKNNDLGLVSFTLKTAKGDEYSINYCKRLDGPKLLSSNMSIFWGEYEQAKNNDSQSIINAFVFRYNSTDLADLLVLDE